MLLIQNLYCICPLGRHASLECQRNNRQNQTVPHRQKVWNHVVAVVDIVVAADVVAARARP